MRSVIYCPTARLLLWCLLEPSGQATKKPDLLCCSPVGELLFLFKCAVLPNYSIISIDENNPVICKHLVTHNAICYTRC